MEVEKELVVNVVQLRGSAFQIGVAQSGEFKSSSLQKQLEILRVLTQDSNPSKAEKELKKFSPIVPEEIKGLAEGLGLSEASALKIFSGYGLVLPKMGCTAMVHNGLYARNYDFSPEFYDARLVFSCPIDGYSSVGFSQHMIGRLDGMNEKGLVVGLHFVNDEDRAEGFIATTIVRILLEQCANTEEAIRLLHTLPHGYCYNYSITDSSGESVLVETSPEQQVLRYTNLLACTNHFESAELKEKNRAWIQSSVDRKVYAEGLINEDVNPLTIYHHFNKESSPLFFKEYHQFFGTLHTVVYSPKDLTMLVGIGGNCEPTMFSLKEYMDGHEQFPKTLKGICKIKSN